MDVDAVAPAAAGEEGWTSGGCLRQARVRQQCRSAAAADAGAEAAPSLTNDGTAARSGFAGLFGSVTGYAAAALRRTLAAARRAACRLRRSPLLRRGVKKRKAKLTFKQKRRKLGKLLKSVAHGEVRRVRTASMPGLDLERGLAVAQQRGVGHSAPLAHVLPT
jgi:hypothetical protein